VTPARQPAPRRRRAWAAIAAIAAIAATAAIAPPGEAAGAGAAAAGPSAAAAPRPIWDEATRRRILAHGPWPAPPAPDASNRVQHDPAAVALGRRLFHDASLSRRGDRSCAQCHDPRRAFGDGLAVPAGGTRHTPSLIDAARWRWFGWDGANDSLWAASTAALLNRAEMGHTPASLGERVRADAGLRSALIALFGPPRGGDEAIAAQVGKALAAFQATLASPRTPFDDFRDALARGDRPAMARYPVAAERGLAIFVGRGRCFFCHAGPGFTNGEFADIGRPFFLPGGGVDAGRHAGLGRLATNPYTRLGAHNDAGAADPAVVTTRQVIREHRHFGEFRVPSLRGGVHTAPFMHDGSVATIEGAVAHYSELDEDRLHADGQRILEPLHLSAAEAADLAAFLRSLSAAAPLAPPWAAAPLAPAQRGPRGSGGRSVSGSAGASPGTR
jgi:cytochrome c peroxidase